MRHLIVTKHPAVEKYLKDNKICPPDTPCMSYITESFALGCHIYGQVPLNIASKAYKYTEVKVTLPRKNKPNEIDDADLLKIIKYIKTYQVKELENIKITGDQNDR